MMPRSIRMKKGTWKWTIELNLKTETDALEAGHGITLYTFDEYGRLMHYAHIVASTPKEREDGYADYFLTIFKGGN